MPRFSLSRWRTRAILAVTLALVLTLTSSIFAFAAVPIVQISSDPYTNSTSQHQTMVEPDTFSFGSTIVTSWSNPVVVHAASGSENLDKDWIVCDTTSTSFYGHCYVEWDDNGASNVIHVSTSVDGGNTWGSQQNTANNATGIGGQPLVQPNGTVIVPIDNANETSVLAFNSTNGGTSWSSTTTVASIQSHTDAGSIRSGPLPSAEIDGGLRANNELARKVMATNLWRMPR